MQKIYNNFFISAFTLIELMVVIAVIATLTVVGAPVYKNYTLKSKVAHAISVLSSQKSNIIEVYSKNSEFPLDGTEIFSASSVVGSEYQMTADFGQNIETIFYRRVDLQNAYIGVEFLSTANELDLQSKRIYFGVRNTNGDVMEYACGIWNITDPDSVSTNILPSSCQEVVSTFLGTN